MFSPVLLKRFLLPVLGLALAGMAQAQAPGTNLSAAQIHVQEADLSSGGQASVDASQLSFSHTWALDKTNMLGLQLRAEQEDWSFQGSTRFPAAPWGKVQRYGLGLSYMRGLGDGWQLMLSPRADWAGEEGAESGDSASYGLMSGGFKVFGPGQRVGFGLSVARGLDDDLEAFPFILVDWRFNERWRLFNPLGLGPSGPAGLELAYRFNDSLELGLGGSWRNARFRLASDNAVSAGGIGRVSYVPMFLHLSWKPIPRLSLDAYAGMLLSGRLEVEDRSGNSMIKEDLENTPMLALAASFRF